MKRNHLFLDLEARESRSEDEDEGEESGLDDEFIRPDDSDEDVNEVNMDVDVPPAQRREGEVWAEGILNRIRQRQSEHQAAALLPASEGVAVVEGGALTLDDISPNLDLYCVSVPAQRVQSRIQSLESLTPEKLLTVIQKPLKPKFPHAQPVIDAFIFGQSSTGGRIYILAPQSRAESILKAANITTAPTFIANDKWQDDQPWLNQRSNVLSSNTRQGMYCTPIPAKTALFHVTLSFSSIRLKETAETLKQLNMANLADVWTAGHSTGSRSLASRQVIESAEGKLVHAFTFRRLPGRIFLFASAKLVTSILHTIRIYTKPILIPPEEWHGENTVPWEHSSWKIGSLSRVQRGKYHGCLGYVVGASKYTDAIVLAVVPRITKVDLAPQTKRPRLEGSDSAPPKGRTTKGATALFSPDVVRELEQQRNALLSPKEIQRREQQKKSLVSYEYNPVIISEILGTDCGDYDWVLPGSSGKAIHQYEQKCFYLGLLLLSLDGHRAIESTAALSAEDIEPFVISGIDRSLDLLLSQMHWKIGQLVKGKEGVVYKIVMPRFDDREVDVVTVEGEPLSLVLRMDQVRPYFRSGDEVIVLVGCHKSQSGLVLIDDIDFLTILDTMNQEITVPRLWVAIHLSPHALATSYPFGAAVDVLDAHGTLKHGIITGTYENEVLYVKLLGDQDMNMIKSFPKSSIQKVYPRPAAEELAQGHVIRLNDYVRVASGGLFGRLDGKAGYVVNITIKDECRLQGGSIGGESVLLPGQYLSRVDIRRFDLVAERGDLWEKFWDKLMGERSAIVLELTADGNALLSYTASAEQSWVRTENLDLMSRISMGDQVRVLKGIHREKQSTVLSDIDANGTFEIGIYTMAGEKKVLDRFSAIDLKKVVVKYHSLSHPWLHKTVLIRGNNAWKGKRGEAISHIPAYDSFMIWVHGSGYIHCKGSELSLLDDSQDSIGTLDSLEKSRQHLGTIGCTESFTLRASTPAPTDDLDLSDELHGHFLNEPSWQKANFHISCSFVLNNAVNMAQNRVAHSYLPFNSDGQKVFVYWTDNKGKLRKGMVPWKDFVPTFPKQKGQHVVVLDGKHRGERALIQRYSKGKCYLKQSERVWVQEKESLCVIEPHIDGGGEKCGCTVQAIDA